MTILISSTNASTRDRWKQVLQNDYQILEASTVAELNTTIQQKDVGLVLLHRSMVDMDFIAGLSQFRFFVFSDTPEDNEALVVLKCGAVGYANTYISPARLKEAVRSALSGRVWVGQSLMQKIIRGTGSEIRHEKVKNVLIDNLSEREREVALLVGKGESNLQIAADLNVAESTVKAHVGSIFKKTKTESRLQLALLVKALLSQ
jgi:two-component system, NarL family, nitrate/nitrite response regulator NarL